MRKLFLIFLLLASINSAKSQILYEIQPEDEQHTNFLYAEFGLHGRDEVKIVVFTSYIYRYKYDYGYDHPVLYDDELRTRLKLAFLEKIEAIVRNEVNPSVEGFEQVSYMPHQQIEWAYKISSYAKGTGSKTHLTVGSTIDYSRNVRSQILQEYRDKGYKIFQTTFDEFYEEDILNLKLENVDKLNSYDYENYYPGSMRSIAAPYQQGKAETTTQKAQNNQPSTSQPKRNSGGASGMFVVPTSVAYKGFTDYKSGYSYFYNAEGIYYTFIFDRYDKPQAFYPWSDIRSIEATGNQVRIEGTYQMNNRSHNEAVTIDVQDGYDDSSVAKYLRDLQANHTGKPTEDEIAEANRIAERKIAEERRREELRLAEVRRLAVQKRKAVIERLQIGKLPTSSSKLSASTVYFFIFAYDPELMEGDQPTLYVSNVFPVSKYSDDTWPLPAVIGKAVGNQMNLGTTLAVYATICKETNRQFRWPGSEAQWNGLSDVTDARVLAKHLVWAATTETAHNEAFNVVNGEYFRWKWLWKRLASWFEVEPIGFDGTIHPLETEMAQDATLWRDIAGRYNLVEPDLSRLASPWHTDLDLGRPIEVMTDMSKSRKLGFTVYQGTEESFIDLFNQLRKDRLIP